MIGQIRQLSARRKTSHTCPSHQNTSFHPYILYILKGQCPPIGQCPPFIGQCPPYICNMTPFSLHSTPPRLRTGESMHLVCFWPSPTSMARRERQLWASAVQWWVGTIRSTAIVLTYYYAATQGQQQQE